PLNEAGSTMILLTRSAPSISVRNEVSNLLTQLAPTVPISSVATLAESLDERLGEQRMFVRVTMLCTALAILLAAVGVYALLAFAVAERTRELGIRIALGARAGQVSAMVLREGAWLAAIGVAIGLAGGFALARVIASRLYGVS